MVLKVMLAALECSLLKPLKYFRVLAHFAFIRIPGNGCFTTMTVFSSS